MRLENKEEASIFQRHKKHIQAGRIGLFFLSLLIRKQRFFVIADFL
jgi:hypothetical protein